MSMARVVITAVVVEGRSKSEVARDYGVSRRWVITLVQRYPALVDGAFIIPAILLMTGFGGREMPLREADALVVHECTTQLAAR